MNIKGHFETITRHKLLVMKNLLFARKNLPIIRGPQKELPLRGCTTRGAPSGIHRLQQRWLMKGYVCAKLEEHQMNIRWPF